MQLACVAIVLVYVAMRLRDKNARETLKRLLLLAAASWVGEDSVIRAYGFYSYDARWSLFVDRVPLLIVVIWPVVIDSAWQLARRLTNKNWVVPVAAALVLADASLIEPIAVRAGLWRWTQPGLFAVPPIGILGWALFAAAALWLYRRAGAFTILLAPLATHALLLASWWGALRWLSLPIPPWAGVALAWSILLPIALWARANKLAKRIPVEELLVRLPGAIFFFALLALNARAPLIAYAAAFVPPYLALMAR